MNSEIVTIYQLDLKCFSKGFEIRQASVECMSTIPQIVTILGVFPAEIAKVYTSHKLDSS